MNTTHRLALVSLLATITLLFTGCVSTKHFALQDIKTPSLITTTSAGVTITADFAAHRDEVKSGEIVIYTFPTGEVAKKIFTGSVGSSASLQLVSSQLTIDTSDQFPLPVFSTKARFSVSCVMQRDGKKTPLSATAAGETNTDAALAARMAVERALLDIAKQVAALE